MVMQEADFSGTSTNVARPDASACSENRPAKASPLSSLHLGQQQAPPGSPQQDPTVM